jgi:hypothetical protein
MSQTENFLQAPANQHVRHPKDCKKPEPMTINYGSADDLIVERSTTRPSVVGSHDGDGGVHLFNDQLHPFAAKLTNPDGSFQTCKVADLTARHEINGGSGVDELRFAPLGDADPKHRKSAFAVKQENGKLVLKNLYSGTEYSLNSVELVRFGNEGTFLAEELLQEALSPTNVAISLEATTAAKIAQGNRR